MYMLFGGKTRKSRRSYSVTWKEPSDNTLRQRFFYNDKAACGFADRLEWDGIDSSNIVVK